MRCLQPSGAGRGCRGQGQLGPVAAQPGTGSSQHPAPPSAALPPAPTGCRWESGLRCAASCNALPVPACPLLPCLRPAPLCPAATPCTWSSGVPAVPTWATGRVFGLWGVLGFCICVPCVARRHPALGADTAEPFAPRGDGGSKGTAAVPRSSCSTKEPKPRTNWLWHGGRGAQRVDGHRTECCRTLLAPTQLTRAACRAGGGAAPHPMLHRTAAEPRPLCTPADASEGPKADGNIWSPSGPRPWGCAGIRQVNGPPGTPPVSPNAKPRPAWVRTQQGLLGGEKQWMRVGLYP